jgi:hypothetical protein
MARTSAKTKKASRAAAATAIVAQARKVKARAASDKKARGEALLALIERRKQRIVEDFYDLGLALKELLDDELYVALGHRTFAELLSARNVVSASSAKKLIAVVEHVSREQALRLGREKAYALVAYAAASPEADVPSQLAAIDAEIAGKKVSALSTRDIEEAARRARQAARKPSPEEKAAERAGREAIAQLRGLAKRRKLGAIEIAREGDRIVLSLTLEQVARLTA